VYYLTSVFFLVSEVQPGFPNGLQFHFLSHLISLNNPC